MPAKPSWYSKLDDIIRELERLPRPFVDRATLEFLLGVGRRRAQQILAPCITERVGTNGLADRDALIARLRRVAEGDDGHYERLRRRNVAEILAQLLLILENLRISFFQTRTCLLYTSDAADE